MPDFAFEGSRTDYKLNLAPGGTLVVKGSSSVLVPFGQTMSFGGEIKFSKNTLDIVHHITSHLESYVDWSQLADLPVNFLRTSAIWNVPEGTQFFPDRGDMVVVSYVNSSEFTAVGGWDFAFNPEWDKDGDYRIDAGITDLPGYVDTRVFNADWNNYVAKYWDPSWLEELKHKIDWSVSQGFDGIMLDVMTPYWTWLRADLGYDLDFLRSELVKLFEAISSYAKSTYGDSFIISANIDPDAFQYFPNLGDVIDTGYYQNAFWDWDGSGNVNSYGPGTHAIAGDRRAIDFLTEKGLAVLTMDHLGTGPRGPGYEHFVDYDSRITPERLLQFLFDAQSAGVVPNLSPLLFGEPYALIPRFATVDGQGNHAATAFRDYVIGSPGNDRIFGGAGNDAVVAGAGHDIVSGGTGNDLLYGQDGNDVLIGGAGEDKLFGGPGIDTASYAGDEGGVFVNLTLGRGYGNASFGDTYDSIENVIGTDYNDFIIGDPGVNRLDGAGGNDTLIGAVGPDELVGGAGDDWASYEDNSGTVFVNLTLKQGFNNAAEGDTYTGIENLIGGLMDDFFIGDDGPNRLNGAMGADTLLGAGGADIFMFTYAPGAESTWGNPNVDLILDFTTGEDKIELSAAAFPGLAVGVLSAAAFHAGTAAQDADDRIIYDSATGKLWFDADGTGGQAAMLFATLGESSHPAAIAASDFVVV